MNILITGGTGLIGKALVEQCILRGERVTVLTRSQKKAQSLFYKNASPSLLNQHKGNDDTHIFLPHPSADPHISRGSKKIKFIASISELTPQDQFDAIINLAGEPIFDKPWTEQQKKALRESRLTITQQLVTFINQSQHHPIFISGSATGIYGDQGTQVITETSPTSHTFTAKLCQDWENIALQAKARVCLIRTGMVFSAKGGALTKMLPIYKWGFGGILGDGKQYYPWIALKDMVNGILFLLDNPQCQGAFNFSAPHPIKQRELNRTLGKILRRPAFAHVPKWLLNLILGERANLLLESQKAIPEKLLQAEFKFQYLELGKILENFFKK